MPTLEEYIEMAANGELDLRADDQIQIYFADGEVRVRRMPYTARHPTAKQRAHREEFAQRMKEVKGSTMGDDDLPPGAQHIKRTMTKPDRPKVPTLVRILRDYCREHRIETTTAELVKRLQEIEL